MVRRMQITNAADRLATDVETKRARRPWNSDLHPRDSKGRFVETGGIARLWGGGLARVVRALGGRNVLVENTATHQRSTIHASRLTMVTRPDGSRPTRSKKKVRDEDERRTADPRRGTGAPTDDAGDDPGDDPGDDGDTPDDPHDQDDQGEDIGEDADGEDLGAGPEPEDDEPVLPRGRVFQNGEAATQNPERVRYPTALPMPESRHARHRVGQGEALRAPRGTPKANGSHLRFQGPDHANAAVAELKDDYLAELQRVWDGRWDDSDARDLYEALLDGSGFDIEVNHQAHDRPTEYAIDDLPSMSSQADELAEIADRAGKTDIAEAAATLSSALELAAIRFDAHGDKPISKPRKNAQPLPSAWEPVKVVAKMNAKPSRRRNPNRRFKSVDDVRAHWASGNLRPFSTDEERQASHAATMQSFMDRLEKPQLSRNGHFTVGKLPAKNPADGPYGWGVIHNDTGVRMAIAPRKGEGLDFANRMEAAEFNGKPVDWDKPDSFDIFRTDEGMRLGREMFEETRAAFAARAAQKREGATARTKPAPETPAPSPEQQIADTTGIPAANVGVGHVGGPDGFGDERGRPRNDAELREFWKRGGSDDTPEAQRDVLRRYAKDPKYNLYLADHRGFAITEDTSRNDEFRYQLLGAGTGRHLSGLGGRGLQTYGNFADRDTADRFALYLGSNLRHEDGRAVDWGGPRLNNELKDFRDKDGQPARSAIWRLAGQFDRDRGATDSYPARNSIERERREREQRQTGGEGQNPGVPETPENVPEGDGQEDERSTDSPEDTPESAQDNEQLQETDAGSPEDAPEGEQGTATSPVKAYLDRAANSLGPVLNEFDDDERLHKRFGRSARRALDDDADGGDQTQGLDELESLIQEAKRKLSTKKSLNSAERRYLQQFADDALSDVREARKLAAARPKARRQRTPENSGADRPQPQDRELAAAELELALDQMILAQRGTLQDDETSRGQIERAQALIEGVRNGETDSAADLSEILAEVEQGIRGRTDGLDDSSKRYWLNELAEARQALMQVEARLGASDNTSNRRTPPADTGANSSEQVRQAGTDVLDDVPSGRAAVPGQRGGADRVLRGSGQPDSGEDRGSRRGADEEAAARDDAGRTGVPAASPVAGNGNRAGRGDVPAEGARDGAPGTGRDAGPAAGAVDAARFRPGSQDDLAPSGERAKAKANVAAVQTLRLIQAEERPATPDEQKILARWSGWGSLPVVLSDKPNPNDKKFRDEDGEPNPEAYARALKRWEAFADERAEIRALLDDKEWAAARKNTLNAHYSDSALVQPVWDAIRALGFRRGRVLEPGSGSGNFIGHAPDGAEMVGVELDPTSAAISQLLYPDAQVINAPFQDLRLPPDSFDLAIGNVPFGRYQLHDPLDNPGRHHSIHDHFILKSLARVRPGGYVAMITSRYTMDAEDDSARRAMYDMADLVGAVRLPEGAHQRAAGTHVVTDLLLFRRREPSKYRHNRGDDSWLSSNKVQIGGHDVAVNQYFQDNPKNVLGRMEVGRGQFTDHDLTVKGDSNTLVTLRAALGRIAADADADGLEYDASGQNEALSLDLAGDARDGSIARGENGAFMTVENGNWVELDVHPKQREQLGRLLELKDVANRLVELEASTKAAGETSEMREARAALNRAYDAYLRKHPSPNKPSQRRQFSTPEALARKRAEGLKDVPDEWKTPTALALFEEDPDGHMVFGLDRWDADAKAPRKLNILSERVLQPREIPDSADSPEDAVAIALEHDGGRLNLPTVARLLGMDQDAAREALGDLAFDDPATGRLEARSAYLSGNVRQKLEEARAVLSEDPKYAVNVAALERVVPKDIRPEHIRVKIGAPWVPIDVYEGFLRHLGLSDAQVIHFGGNRWGVDGSDKGEIAKKVWGVKGRSAYQLFDSLLHQKLITIKESQKLPDGSTKSYVNQKATSAARTKAKNMAAEFHKWVMSDPERASRLGRIYNDKFNSIALRDYDDSDLTLPGIKTGWRMRPHQNAAIRRITQEPTTLLGHVVGAGKTATMVGGAMELRRTGLAKKPAIVVPNHMLEQFSREAVGLYPGAKVLAISRKDLHHKRRRKFIAKIAGGDWDAVVLTHDAFNAMPMTPQTQQAYMDEELALLRSQIEKIKERDGDDPSLKQMEQTLANQEEQLKERLDTLKDERGIFFENTGIDYLFVDEAHEYKNLRTVSNLPGAAISGSGQATQLHMALGYLREHNESGRVASLATGTPIANSVTEAYVLMRYLAPHILEEAGIEDFDSWAATFGEVITSLELAPDGSGDYREKARFAKFFNVPELLVGYRTFADIQTASDLGLPTPTVRAGENGRRGEVISIPASAEQRQYVQSLADEDWITEPGGVLKAIGFASRAAIDMRLQGGSNHEGGKLEAAAEQIAKLYEEHKDTVYPVSRNDLTPQELPGSLQLVFLDEGTPGSTGKIKFDAYGEIRDLLIAQGVPREKIRFIHEAKDDKAKAKLFEEARNGKVAVLIGSTQKMGTGTNVQDRAVALHHLSFPWRPADMEQRDGRIERQGNLNTPNFPAAPGRTPTDVRIMYYITEGTFDEFRLGTLERKAVFINQMARRDFKAREMEDIGDAAVSLGTFKAIASGNPAIAERALAQGELVEIQRQNADWYEQQQERRERITHLTSRIASLEAALPGMREALAARQDVSGDNFAAAIDGVDFDNRADAAEALGRRMDAIAKDTRHGEGSDIPLGEIGGVGFIATVEYDREGNRMLRLRLDHAPAYANSSTPDTRGLWSARKVSDSSGRGAIQSLENLLKSLDSDIEKRQKELDGARVGRETAEDHLEEGTSPFEEQVESTERRVQALTEMVMHHQEARKLTDRIKEVGASPDSARLKQRLKEVQQETRALEAMAEQERAKTFRKPEPKPRSERSERREASRTAAGTAQTTLNPQKVREDLESLREGVPAPGAAQGGGTENAPESETDAAADTTPPSVDAPEAVGDLFTDSKADNTRALDRLKQTYRNQFPDQGRDRVEQLSEELFTFLDQQWGEAAGGVFGPASDTALHLAEALHDQEMTPEEREGRFGKQVKAVADVLRQRRNRLTEASPEREKTAPADDEAAQTSPAAEPYASFAEWRIGLLPVDAAEVQFSRAATALWGRDDNAPGAVPLVRRAIFDAVAALEDDDYEDAERRLVDAREHAFGLLETLTDSERGEMEGPLRQLLDAIDSFLPRHRASRAKWQGEDEQSRRIDDAARAQVEQEYRDRHAQASPTPPSPSKTPNAESDASTRDQSKGDRAPALQGETNPQPGTPTPDTGVDDTGTTTNPTPRTSTAGGGRQAQPSNKPAASTAGRGWQDSDFEPGDTVHFWDTNRLNPDRRGVYVRAAGPDAAVLRAPNGDDELEVRYADMVGRTRNGQFQDDPPRRARQNDEQNQQRPVPASSETPAGAPAQGSGQAQPDAPTAQRSTGQAEDSAPAEPQRSPADMTNDQLTDAIDDLEAQLSPLTESTDPLDLAMRRRIEQQLFEHQEEERRRWTPEPEYDENGKEVERSRGSVVRDRLSGYGLNDAEAQGLVTRVEDLPDAKPGGFSDEEWARIDAAAAANEAYAPTDEQNIIIQGAARRGLNMAVMALAGTGKSSTLKMLSHRMPGKNIVYLAFNRSVAAEARESQARGEYAKNMLASTANAYAARVADRRLNDRLPSNRAGGFKKLSAQQIADRMRWYDTVKAGNRDISPGGAATVAERMIRTWAKSADTEMGPQHVPGETERERRDLFNAVKPLADRMWANLTDPEAGNADRDLPMDFDYIVKQWAMSGYKLDADVLFWDEAQDVNPVMEGVVRAALDQGVQVVAVGDSNQAIYGFRGASDALSKLPVDARATLTQSFRFGPAVADVGNRFLRLLGTRMRLKGFDRKQSRIETIDPGDETMVIARTNAGVALAAVQALTAGRTVAVSGGVKALQEFVQAANALAEGEETDHAELARFNGMPYDDILEEVKSDPDLQQLKSLFALLEKHGDDIDALLESGARPASTELVGDRVWVKFDWNAPKASQLKDWFKDKNNGVGRLLYDTATRRYYYEPGKRDVPWKMKNGRSGVTKVDNKLSLEEAQQRIDAYLDRLYPQEDAEEGKGRLVPDTEPHDVLVTTAHKAKGLESARVRIADDFKGPEDTDNGTIDWDTIPDDEALRVAYVAVTRATEVLDAGSLGWVFRAVNDEDPTEPPKSEYRRDFEIEDFQAGDRVDFQEEDGTPNIGTVSEIDRPFLTVQSEGNEFGGSAKRQEISVAQVQRRNGEGPPRLPVASDEELDQAVAEGRYGSGADTTTLNPAQVRADLTNLNSSPQPVGTNDEESTGSPDAPAEGSLNDTERQRRQDETAAIIDELLAAEQWQRDMGQEQTERLDALLSAYRNGEADPADTMRQIADELEQFAAEVGATESGTGRGRLGAGQARKGRDLARQAAARHDGDNQNAPESKPEQTAFAEGDDVVTPHGPGAIRHIADNGFALVATDSGMRPVALSELRRPDESESAADRARKTEARAKREAQDEWLAAAATSEGAPIKTMDGYRLAHLDVDAGHGAIMRDGEMVAWIRARGRKGEATWMAQDARGGSPRTPAISISEGKGEDGLYRSIKQASWSAAYDAHSTVDPSHGRGVTSPEDMRGEILGTLLTKAQFRELGNLAERWKNGDDETLRLVARNYYSGPLSAGQMRYAADAIDREANDLDLNTADGRRVEKLYLALAKGVRFQARALEASATMPPPGEPDPFSRRGNALDSQAPDGDGAPAAGVPNEITAADSEGGDVLAPDQVSEGDYVRVETQNTAGNTAVREGYVLAAPKKATATRDRKGIKAWRLYIGPQGQEPSPQNAVTILTDQKVERLPAPEPPRDDDQEQPTNSLGWKGPEETREEVADFDGQPVEVGELHVTGGYAHRVVYLGGQRIGFLHAENGAWRAQHDRHGTVDGWFLARRAEDGDPTRNAALAIARSHENGEGADSIHFRFDRVVPQEEAERILASHIDPRTGELWRPSEPLIAPEPDQPSSGWKGPEESRETAGERGGKTVEVGEIHVTPAKFRFHADEVRRVVYLDGERIGSLLYNDRDFNGGTSWRADHDLHGPVGARWYRSSDFDNPAHAAALIVAEAHPEPILSFPGDVSEIARSIPIRRWAGMWAEPQPAGIRNVYLDRVLAHKDEGWTPGTDPYEVQFWISTMADVEPLAQYDENTRRSLEEVPQEGRQFLADLAEDLRTSVGEMGDELRADIRPILVDHIATRNGRKKAQELRSQLIEERVQKVREAVREQIARARAGAGEHGLSEQQAEDFLVNVVGGDSPDQKAYGIRGEFPEAIRPLNAALSDSKAYWAAFAGWATQDDSSNWAGMHWSNGRRESIGAPMAPSADARTGTGELKIGEAELPKGMRWARGSELRKGDIFHTMRVPRRGTTDTFDGMETPQYVIHTHRGGVEGAVRSVGLDADGGHDRVEPDEWVVLVEKPEPSVRKRATNRARTDIFTNWEVPVDDETYELGGPERVKALVARAEVTADDKDKPGLNKEWTVRVDGVVVGRIDNTNKDKVLEYVSVTPDGERRVWHGQDLATAGLVIAHDEASVRDGQDGNQDRSRDDQTPQGEAEGGEGGRGGEPPNRNSDPSGDADDDDRDESDSESDTDGRRRDRRRREGDRERPNGDDGLDGPNADGPDSDNDDQNEESDDNKRRRRRDRDQDRGRDQDPDGRGLGVPNLPGNGNGDGGPAGSGSDGRGSSDGDPALRLANLKDRYRSGQTPAPQGANPEEHAAYLRGLADNDTLALSAGGGLITWSNDGGRSWQFGHAASGVHLAGWEADGNAIGGRDGALRLASDYEGLRDENGDPIDWAAPELDAEGLRSWQDADGNPLGKAIDQARRAAIEARPDSFSKETEGADSRTDERTGGGAPGAGDGTTGNVGQAAGTGAGEDGAAGNTGGAQQSAGAAFRYAVNAEHGEGLAGSVDGRRIPTMDEMREQETAGDRYKVVSEEGEQLLFGSPQQQHELAEEGTVPTPVPQDFGAQVWRNGRLIGRLGESREDSVWRSRNPFTLRELKFSSREAAVAHLVLRDKERGEPDPGIVHPDLAWNLRMSDHELAFPPEGSWRGLESLPESPQDMERYEALRRLMADLGQGRTPSGNVADDLATLHDELRWLDATHYKHQPSNLKDRYILGPGWMADKITEYLDILRPEDPRAQHHDLRKNRAARQVLDELQTSDWKENAEHVPVGDLREGDVVHLKGRITGLYPGAEGQYTGYVIGKPTTTKYMQDKKRYKGLRITVSKDPFAATRSGAETFIIPDEAGPALRLARAEDVNLPFDQHMYGRRVGETPDNGTSSRATGAPEDAPDSSTGGTGTAAGTGGDDGGGAPSPSSATGAGTTAADGTASTSRPRPDSSQTRRSGDTDSGSRRGAQPASSSATTAERPSTPESVGGRPAEWVQVSGIQLGDLVRVDGTTKGGTARTLAGYVVGGPETKPVTRKGRAQDMLRVLIADTPDARTGSPVYVPMDGAAARATRDDEDQFQGSPFTGADSDVLTGRIAERVPTDANGNGLFPGSVVTDDNGREGVVTGASANSVRVQFGDDRTDDEHAPTSISVTDGGAGRPAGWTLDGHLVREGNVVGDRDGNMLGIVESVDGDTAAVATPRGVQPQPIDSLRVLGGVREADGRAPSLRLEPTTYGELNVGDVVFRDDEGPAMFEILSISEGHSGRRRLETRNTTTGEIANRFGAIPSSPIVRVVDADGNTPRLGPEDAPAKREEIISRGPAATVTPVTDSTVDPQLSPEERDAITEGSGAAASDPEAQQAAARVANDLPVTPQQAGALAEELREGADSTTPEGRAAQRAADRLDAATGNEPERGRPEPGTIGAVGVGDTVTLPDEFDPNTMTAYRIVLIEEAPAGVRTLTIEDGDGLRFKRSMASSEALYQLPDPEAPSTDPDDEERDPNPVRDADKVRSDYADSVTRAVIDEAVQGTTTPGSIHQLREQIAQQLTPQALRAAMRRARNTALTAINDAGFTGEERDELVKSLREEAARARTDAIRAAVRTLDDLEPLDGETEEDTARRAADLLRLIPEALRNRLADDDSSDGDTGVNDAVNRHADDAVGEALQDAAAGGPLTEERAGRIVRQLASRMDGDRAATAQRIATTLPAADRPAILPHIVAALVAIARKVIAVIASLLRALAKAWRRSRESLARFRRNLAQRIRTWPETRRLRRLAAAANVPVPDDSMSLGDRMAHWARLMPAPGRFGQVSRRARWYRPTSRSSLASGQLPQVQDGVRWMADRAADGGPGPQALRHLAAVRAAGQDVDAEVASRLAGATPELGDDPHGTVRHVTRYADITEARLRDLQAAAAGGAPDADLEIAAARVEAQSARQEATRLRQAYAASLPEVVRDILAEVREMGPGTTATLVTTEGSDADAVRSLTDIAQFVPRDWLSPTESRFISARGGDAGGYDPDNRTATVADLGDGGRRTAAYALLAHLQQHYPDLLAAQEAFAFTRTHSGRVGARRRTALDRLLARLFSNPDGRDSSGDLVPRGLETMFDGDWYKDDDLRAFLLGLLATR